MGNYQLSGGELAGIIETLYMNADLPDPETLPQGMDQILIADLRGFRARMSAWYIEQHEGNENGCIFITGSQEEMEAAREALLTDRRLVKRGLVPPEENLIFCRPVESTTGNAHAVADKIQEMGLPLNGLYALSSNTWHVFPRCMLLFWARGMSGIFPLGRTSVDRDTGQPIITDERLSKEAVALMEDLEAMGRARAGMPVG